MSLGPICVREFSECRTVFSSSQTSVKIFKRKYVSLSCQRVSVGPPIPFKCTAFLIEEIKQFLKISRLFLLLYMRCNDKAFSSLKNRVCAGRRAGRIRGRWKNSWSLHESMSTDMFWFLNWNRRLANCRSSSVLFPVYTYSPFQSEVIMVK